MGMAECAAAGAAGPGSRCPPLLIDEGTRYTGDQETLPLSPLWITRQLREAAAFCEGEEITGEAMQTMLARRVWREGYGGRYAG